MPPGPTNASGLRSRKVDFKKSLTVYRWNEIDLNDTTPLNRTQAQVSTGVEKEEEEEHHLQAALYSTTHNTAPVVIPTPDASKLIPDYSTHYPPTFSQPKSLIRFSTQVEDVIGCPYNCDERDDGWRDEFRERVEKGEVKVEEEGVRVVGDDDEFERWMWALEKCGDAKVSGDAPTLQECESHILSDTTNAPSITIPHPALPHIYEHWKQRRYVERGGKGIMPRLKSEKDAPLTSDSDPYICFRIREVKPVRKARRCDTQSLEKLRRLRDEMTKAKEILEMVTKREATRKESVNLEHLIFEQRVLVRRLKKKLGVAVGGEDVGGGVGGRTGGMGEGDEGRKRKSVGKGLVPRIRIATQSITSNASVPGGAELGGGGEGGERGEKVQEVSPISEGASWGEKVKKMGLMDLRGGVVDCIEHPYINTKPPDDPYRFYRPNLPITLHPAPSTPLSPSTHTLTHRIPYGRRRIGRGGRLHFDRHVRRGEWVPQRRGGKKRPWEDDEGVGGEEDEERWRAWEGRWRFDCSDEEVEDDGDGEEGREEDVCYLWYRSAHLNPTPRDREYRLFETHPSHPDQLSITATPLSQRPPPTPLPPPTVIRLQPQQPVAVQPAAKRVKKAVEVGQQRVGPVGGIGGGVGVQQQQQQPPGRVGRVPADPRQAQIQNMLKASQMNMQREQQRFLGGGGGGALPPGTPGTPGVGGQQHVQGLVQGQGMGQGSPPPPMPTGVGMVGGSPRGVGVVGQQGRVGVGVGVNGVGTPGTPPGVVKRVGVQTPGVQQQGLVYQQQQQQVQQQVQQQQFRALQQQAVQQAQAQAQAVQQQRGHLGDGSAGQGQTAGVVVPPTPTPTTTTTTTTTTATIGAPITTTTTTTTPAAVTTPQPGTPTQPQASPITVSSAPMMTMSQAAAIQAHAAAVASGTHTHTPLGTVPVPVPVHAGTPLGLIQGLNGGVYYPYPYPALFGGVGAAAAAGVGVNVGGVGGRRGRGGALGVPGVTMHGVPVIYAGAGVGSPGGSPGGRGGVLGGVQQQQVQVQVNGGRGSPGPVVGVAGPGVKKVGTALVGGEEGGGWWRGSE
ncbi:Enhancer of polycomb-like protein 1 [Rhizophlyctis rosea]|nr:Enhancer of polycomb-like protein 1 [Rhizophlyctis rosea]